MSPSPGPWGAPPPERATSPPLWRYRGFVAWLALMAAVGVAFFLAWRMLPPGDVDWVQAFRGYGVLALASFGVLIARRITVRGATLAVGGWIAVFAVVVAGYTWRGDVTRAALRLRAAVFPALASADAPRTLTVGRDFDDGFSIIGRVNGAPVRFLIDTGATDIVLSRADAERAGVSTTGLAFTHPSETANGVGFAARATVARLEVGPFHLTDVPVLINQAPMSTGLLGMPFLKRLDSFEVRGDQLVLHGPAGPS